MLVEHLSILLVDRILLLVVGVLVVLVLQDQ